MSNLNYSHTLVAGTPENINDVQDMFNDAKTVINGNLDATNFATSAKPATLLGQYRVISEVTGQVTSASTSGIKMFIFGGTNANATAYNGGPTYTIGLDSSDYSVSGLTTKFRVNTMIMCNATAPGITFTFGLYPLTVAGGAGTMTVTLGTVTTGSTVAVATPSASTATRTAGTDFTPPAAGAYALGVNLSGAPAANSFSMLYARLEIRHV